MIIDELDDKHIMTWDYTQAWMLDVEHCSFPDNLYIFETVDGDMDAKLIANEDHKASKIW